MIEVKEISMYYGSFKAVDSISFAAKKGEVLGLLGPNGAGKTTMMNIIAAHFVPSSGVVRVGGHDVVEEPVEVRRIVGYLPEREPLYPDMEVAEYLKFVGRARGIAPGALNKRMQWVLDACALRPVYRKLLSDLSRGYRQRVGLAQATIHDPEVLILDELTSGLDPLQTSEIRKLVRSLADGGNGGEGKCVIFSTHVMQEAQAVSDRIVIINHGRVVADGKPDDIREDAVAGFSTLITVESERRPAEELLGALPGARDAEFLREEGGSVSFRVKGDDEEKLSTELARMIKEHGWLVKELTPAKPSLEDAFLALTRTSEEPGAPEGGEEESAETGDAATSEPGEEVQQ